MSVLIDCDACLVRGLACHDCVVTVLLGPPPEIGFDEEEQRALDVLAESGLVPQLRMVTPVASDGDRHRERLTRDGARCGWVGVTDLSPVWARTQRIAAPGWCWSSDPLTLLDRCLTQSPRQGDAGAASSSCSRFRERGTEPGNHFLGVNRRRPRSRARVLSVGYFAGPNPSAHLVDVGQRSSTARDRRP